ncbi:MAG TPA: S53 family peptidase, partial [Ktedonobacterales bacterium]|nr:S53 family peptidase [Ktedonobacterales bacterium]
PSETQGEQGFPSIYIGEQYAVTHYPGAVITQSFGSNELSFNAAAPDQVAHFDTVFQQAIANHVTILAASGDTGTTNFDKQGRAFSVPSVNWPSSDPLVTSVGGTWLQDGFRWDPATPTDSSDIVSTETAEPVWNEPPLADASGGGVSSLFATPSFQANISSSLLQGHRGVPDLAWNAAVDGGCLIYTSFGGIRVGWHILGGTSASTPQIAGLVALTNQLAHDQGKGSVGYLNPYLYQLPARDFSDIVPQTFGPGAVTLDNNQQYGSSIPGYPVTTGYDLTTGLGRPNVYNFVYDLAAALP